MIRSLANCRSMATADSIISSAMFLVTSPCISIEQMGYLKACRRYVKIAGGEIRVEK